MCKMRVIRWPRDTSPFFCLRSKRVLHCFWMVLAVVCTTMFLCVESFFWCPCVAINVVSVQYDGGLLPDITLYC